MVLSIKYSQERMAMLARDSSSVSGKPTYRLTDSRKRLLRIISNNLTAFTAKCLDLKCNHRATARFVISRILRE
jgi:hypothetical protein